MDFQIIDDVNETLVRLLTEEFGGAPPFHISFAMPDKNFGASSKLQPTADFYLYDISEDAELRSNQPVVEKLSDGSTRRKQPPARIKLSYLVTAWSLADDPAKEGTRARDEHRLLSKILLALIKYPKIPEKALYGQLAGQVPPLPATVIMPNGLKNPAEFWGTFEGRPVRPALEYNVTFSLDYHAVAEGRMVVAKSSEHGGPAEVFRLAIRPPVRNVAPYKHPAGASLVKMAIDGNASTYLDLEAKKGGEKITVSAPAGLQDGDTLIFVDSHSDATEFCTLKDTANSPELALEQPLLYDHALKTELKKIVPSGEKFEVKLADFATPGVTFLQTAAEEVKKQLKMGDVVKIDNPAKIEYCQITEISGPEVGLGADRDALVHIGGLVTNKVGAPVLGAEISLLDANLEPVKKTYSNVDGRFSFGKLNKGKYTLQAKAQGYAPSGQRTIDEIASAEITDFIFNLETA